MKVPHGLAQLSKDELCLLIRQGLIPSVDRFDLDVLIQTMAADKLLKKEDLFVSLKVLDKPDDIWVVEAFHASNFSLHRSLSIHVIKLVLRIDFDCNSLLGVFVLGEIH
jgi:hypothetical protein